MIELVKGFRDVLPPESLKRAKIREVIEKNFKLFGFIPIETPSLEYESFAKGDNEKDSAVSDMFKLKDRGNRELALRYEFTFQLQRLFKENPNIKLPFRRYQIGYVFRDEPVEKDRYREFIQCDADIMGDASINAEAEFLALADKICKELKIKYALKINNRKILDEIFENLEIIDKNNVLREIDKLGKIGEDEVKKNLTKYADKEQIIKLFKLLGGDLKFFLEQEYAGAKELDELLKLLKIYNIKAEFSPFLARGFSYYTGIVFEAYSEEIKGSIFAGGRFDNLVGKYINRQVSAVGISLGRILDYPIENPESAKYLLISINQDKKTVELMKNLREKGISCLMTDKISRGLDFANSYNIPYVIFVGDEEARKGKFKLKNMKSGREKLVREKELIKLEKNI
ncbi:MAG: histidine--tRNA ligase [Nanoarchaeota archaeon]